MEVEEIDSSQEISKVPLINPEGVSGVFSEVWTEQDLNCFFAENKSPGLDRVCIVRLRLVCGDSSGRITPEGVLNVNLDKKGVALYCGVSQENESEVSTTSNATLLTNVGVLVAVFLAEMGDSVVLIKGLGHSIDFSGFETSIWSA